MAILYESHEDTDSYTAMQGVNWEAQIFTPSTVHTITSIQLRLFKVGSPGILDVGIYAVDENGDPNIASGALCSGSIQGNDLGTNTAGVWTEITLGNGAILAAYTKYAIVCHITGGDAGNYIGINLELVGTYTNGYRIDSIDSGSSWKDPSDYDLGFRDYGINAQYSPIILAPGKIGMWGW